MSKDEKQNQSGYEQLLLDALRRALSPLVRFLLHRGITFPVLSSLIRGLYVEQAQQGFELDNKALSDSRLSLLTGIARRYIKEIRHADNDQSNHLAPKASPGGKLVAQWLTNPAYLDQQQRPMAIPRHSTPGADMPSFESLAQSVNSDVWPTAMLEKLIEMKLIRLDEKDHVHLLVDAYLPGSGSRENMTFFADHLHDHIATLSHNILGEQQPMLERSVYVNELSEDSVDELRKYSEARGSELLRDIYARATDLYQSDKDRADASHRMRLGIYFHSQDCAETKHSEPSENE